MMNKSIRQRKNGKKNVRPSDSRSTQLSWSIVEKDELVSAVSGSASFAASKYAINPGLAATFPIGSPESLRYTEWQADYCEFYFRRTVSEYADQGTKGRVVLACDYSAINDAPDSLQGAEALHCAMGMPSTPEIRLRLDPKILNKADPKYVRSGAIPPHSDVRLYDGGNLWFVTSGNYDTSEIGELRVRYKFRVRLPNLDETYVMSSNTTAAYNLSANMSLTSGVAKVLAYDEVLYDAIGLTNNSGSFVLPAGIWLISAQVNTAGGTSTTQVVQLDLNVDGSAASPPVQRYFSTNAGGTQSNVVDIASVFESDGTTAFTIVITMTSAAGTLVAQADRCRIIFQLV
jgi:hypothetical protein